MRKPAARKDITLQNLDQTLSPDISAESRKAVIQHTLQQRIVTAAVLVAVFLGALVFLPPWGFSLFIGLIVLLAAWEWADLAGFRHVHTRLGYVGFTALLLVAAAHYLLDAGPAIQLRFLASACVWWAIALLWMQGFPSSAILWGNSWVKALMGCFVLVPTWLSLSLLLMDSAAGVLVVLFVVMIVVLMDTGGYVAGKVFGRRKLAPQVSPGKTWAGFAGGLFANGLLVVAAAVVLDADLQKWLLLTGMVAVTACASVLGDLVESMVKRQREVKDSGHLLPGHGGILDRVDGMTAAFPVFTLLYMLLVRDSAF